MSVEASVAALEIRATTAENQLKELQSKAASSDAAVSLRLKELLALMQEDRKEAEEIRATRDELKEENSKLRAQVGKLEYRVVHLLRTINDIEAAAKK
jgi:small-conductance mechanosensitive channel